MESKSITIDGKEYDLASLSEDARAQVVNLRVTDSEIERLNAQLAIHKTARQTYAGKLKALLDQTDQA
jgi:hypothetical protein